MCVACVGLVLVMLAGENSRVQAKGRQQGCDSSRSKLEISPLFPQQKYQKKLGV